MSRTVRRGAAALLAAVLAAILLPLSAGASTDPDGNGPQTWALTTATVDGPDGRGVFQYIVDPDDVYEDFLAVRNFGEQELTVAVYAQDALQTSEHGFEVLTSDEQARRIGAWTTIEATEVTVPARASVVIPFSIAVPADAEPGDHAGAIVAVSTPPAESGTTVQYRTGTRVYMRVAGPVEAGLAVDRLSGHYEPRWSPFAAAPLDLSATLENTGNVRVSPEAVATVSSLFGWWSRSAPLEGFDEILPRGAQSGSARLDEVPPLGPLWVTVEVPVVQSSGQDVTSFTTVVTQTVVVWAVPWVLVIAVSLLLVAAALAIVNLRRRRRARKADGPAMPEDPDTSDAAAAAPAEGQPALTP
ncbi:MAG: hypothetical protein KF727_01000 [Microbacteriaceae bacterium]|nr:hypothetical protein [Microbacteriaceae bacterium]